MREKSAHCPRRDSNLYLWDTRPQCFRLHHDGRHASRQSKQTLQTLTRQLDRETIMHETLQLLSAGPRRQASARTSAESDEACQRKTKDRADVYECVCVCVCVCVCGVCVCVCVCVCQRKTKDRADDMREKVPIPLDGVRTSTSGIRAHRASDYTTRAGMPRVSRNKRFRHSPTSSIVKHKHALRNTPTPICETATATIVCVKNDILHWVNTPTLNSCFGLVGHHQQGAVCEPLESQPLNITANAQPLACVCLCVK